MDLQHAVCNNNLEKHQGSQRVEEGSLFLLDINQFGVVEAARLEDDKSRSAGSWGAVQGGRSHSHELLEIVPSAFSSTALNEGGETESVIQLHTQGQGQSRMQGQGQEQCADGSTTVQVQRPISGKLQRPSATQRQQKVKVNELGQLGTIKNLNKIVSSQQNNTAQESLDIIQHVKKFAEMPPRPTTQASQQAKRDTLESHKLYKKQKLHQQQRQEGVAAIGHPNEKEHLQKVLHHLDGPLGKPKSSKSTSGLPRARKAQKTSKSSLSMNMTKNQPAGKLNGNQSSITQGDGNSSILLNREPFQDPKQRTKQPLGALLLSRNSATRLGGHRAQSGSQNNASLAIQKSAAAPVAASTEKLSQTLGPESFVGLSKQANQSFHMQHYLRSQSRGETNAATKIDKIIRKNLKKQKEKDEQKKKEQDAKNLRDLERKQQIQQQNEWVRQLHKEQYQRSRERRNANVQNTQQPIAVGQNLRKKINKSNIGAVSSKHLLNMTKTSDSTLIELSGVGADRQSRRDDGGIKMVDQAAGSSLLQMRKSHSIQKQNSKMNRNVGNNSPRRNNNGLSSNEQIQNYRRAQRTSQERGNQRVLSGMSRGSRSRSGKSGPSAKSGRSGGGTAMQDGGYVPSHSLAAEQRGHLLGTQSSAHAGGKKDSINSNLSNQNQTQNSNSHNMMIQNKQLNLMNMQQSQQEPSSHQGGALQASQQLDANIVLSRQAREVREHASQESPLKDPGQLAEDLHLRSLEEQLNQISYNNTKNNISQMLQGANNLDDEILPDNYLANLDDTTDFKRLNSQKDLSKTQKQQLQNKLRQANNVTQNAAKAQMKKENRLSSQHNQTHSHDKLNFKNKKGNGLYKHGGSVASGALGLGLPSAGNLICTKQASNNLQKTLNASSLLLAGVGGSSAHNIGMDFLDVKKEILDELKQVDRKAQEKYAKSQRRRQHQLSHKDIHVNDGHMGGQVETQVDFRRTAMIQDSSVQDLRLHGAAADQLNDQQSQNEPLNADIKSCSQTLAKMRSKSSSPIIQKLENESKKNSRNAQQRLVDAPPAVGSQKQPQLQASSTAQRLHTQKTLCAVNPQHAVYLKSQLQKFIKRKQKDKKQLEEQEKLDQIYDVIRVHENLSKLEQFVQKRAAAGNSKTNVVVSHVRPEKKSSMERSRSGGRARSKSRDRKNLVNKKSKIKLAEGGGKISRLSHQNLTTKHQQMVSAFENDEQLSSIKRLNTNNEDILANTQSNHVLNVNLKAEDVSFFKSDAKRISKSQSKDRIVRVQQQNDSLQNLQPIFSNQNIFEHDSHLSEKLARDAGKKQSQFNSKTLMQTSTSQGGHQSGKPAKKRHKSSNKDNAKRLKPYASKEMGRALAKSLSLQNKQAVLRNMNDQKLQQNLKKNHLSKKSLHYESPYSKAKNASSSKSKSRSKSKSKSKQSNTKSKSRSKSNSKQSKSHSRSRKATKRQQRMGAPDAVHKRPPKPKRSARKDQDRPACKTQKIDLPNMKLQDDQLLEILKKINYDFSKPKTQKKKKSTADAGKNKKKSKSNSKSPPQKGKPIFEQQMVRPMETTAELPRTGQARQQQVNMKERQIQKYREERWVVPNIAQSRSQGYLNNNTYNADKVAANIAQYAKATGEESSKEQSLMLQNSRSQQSFTFCDKQSSTFKGLGAQAPNDSVVQESLSQKRSLLESSAHGDRHEQAFQIRNLEMNASSASSFNMAGKPVILDGSRMKVADNYRQREESYASCHSGSQSVRSNRSGILAQLKNKNVGIPSLPQLNNEVFYPQFLPLPADQAQPPFSIAESHRSLNSQKIPTSNSKNRNGTRGSQQQPLRKQDEEQPQHDDSQKWKEKQMIIMANDDEHQEDDQHRQQHDRRRSQAASGQSSSIGMHIEVQGVEINDSSRKSETCSGDLMLKFQKFENIHGLNLKTAGVESENAMQPLTIQAQNDITGSAKFPETSGDVSKVSPIISQININKTIESKRSQSNSQTDMQIDQQVLSKQVHNKFSRSSHQSGSNNQFKQYKEVSMPQSLHSINSQISQLSIQSHLRKMAQNSSRSSKQGVGISGLASSRQAKLSQTCAEGQELLMNDLQTYQKHETVFADDNVGGPTTLISHLNDDQSNDANEFVAATKQIGESQDQGPKNQVADSEMNIKGALRSVKRGEELIDDELLSPRNRLDHLSIEAIEGTGGALSTKDIHQSSQQITAENLLKYLDTKYKEKKQENSSVFEHSRASHLSEQHRQSSRKSPIAHTRKLGFNPSSQPPILSDRKPSPQTLAKADIQMQQKENAPIKKMDLAHNQMQIQLLRNASDKSNERQSSPEAVIESKFMVEQNQIEQHEESGVDEEIREGNNQAVSVLETVEEKIVDEPRQTEIPGQSPMRTLNSLKQSDELNKYLDSDIQSDSSRSPGLRATQEESAQKTEIQQTHTSLKREDQIPQQEDELANQIIKSGAAQTGETQEIEEPLSLFEAENQIQLEDGANANEAPALQQPEMNINSDLTTLNFDPDNSSSSDGRGPFSGAPGLLVQGQAPSSQEPNYQMFMNAKKADQKCLNQFRRRQKRNQQQSEQQQKQKQELGINLDQIEIDIQENSLKGQSSDHESEQVGHQPPTDTEEKYTSRSEGENQEKQQTIFLDDIKFDQDEPKTERNHNLDNLDSDASEDNLFADQNNNLGGQKIKIADIINRKRKSKKSLSGEQRELQKAQPEDAESSSEICRSILHQIIENIGEPSKKSNESEEEQKPQVKKIVSAAQKEIEVFNPAQAQANAGQVPKGKNEADQKPLSVEEYHESLFGQASSSEAPKISPQTSESKDKTSPTKSAQLYKELKADEVFELLRMSINQGELKHQIRQVIEMKQRQNIERDLIRADSYVNELLEYLLQFEIPQGDEEQEAMLLELNGGVNYLALFLTSLTQPQRREVLEELRKMQTQELGSYSHFESCLDPLQFAILPIDMYLDVEKQRQFTYQMTHQEEKREKDLKKQYSSANSAFSAISALSNSITQESQHILHKAIFDAMNESLTKFRPYGLVGEPLPWSNKYRRLQTEVDINSVDTERLFQMVKQEVYRWMSAQQGALTHQRSTIFQYIDLHIPLLPEIEDRIQAIEGTEKQLSNYQKLQMQSPKELKLLQDQQITRLQSQMIEDATQDMRQAKLANLLHQEIIEEEHQWLNYEFEETQIRIDLGEMILESLVQETVDFLSEKEKPRQAEVIEEVGGEGEDVAPAEE